MKLPIDTDQMTFICTAAPEPVRDFETKQPKADENGEPLYAVQLVAMADGTAEIISVKVPGQPSVDQGAMVRPTALVASPWTMGDRSGVAYRAARIEAGVPAAARKAS
ncbi:MAG: hypothetical protein M3N52_04260 [Actinomycetota bacterium]|nr:hypothetical protein [Actinomycetota bacterium]